MDWTKKKLIKFEEKVAEAFRKGEINAPVHLSGGNEDELISIFESIRPIDWVISSHRNHYHYLLKGGSPTKLMAEIKGEEDGICNGYARSMHIIDRKKRFLATGIVGGGCGIAVGLALASKKKNKNKPDRPHVWCFVGDGAEDSGHYAEAIRFTQSRQLPVTFVVEDNDLAVESTKADRWHNWDTFITKNVIRYRYTRRWPHVGVGEHVSM